ncbi:hypothetical protein PMAYCL1PPCAC_18621, partial [Pristionchus mayeri]
MIHLLILVFFFSSLSSADDPRVSRSCLDGRLTVDLTTEFPFEGRIEVGECTVNGNGSRNTQLMIPFVDLDGCSLTHEKSLSSFSSPVSIHFHRALILDSDLSLDVSCFTNPSEYSLVLANHRGDSVEKAVFGDPYQLMIADGKEDAVNEVQVISCTAYGKKSSVELISSCKRVRKSDIPLNKSSIFTFDKMFRLSDSPSRIFVECYYRLCQGECPKECSTNPTSSVSTFIEVVEGNMNSTRPAPLPSSSSSSSSSS